ncbi:hypothetical protein QFZ94_005512 [Paraburkholderia sp. JPY465]
MKPIEREIITPSGAPIASAVGRDAVPRNDPGVVRRADPADPPQDCAGAAQTLAETEHEAAAHQQREAQHRPLTGQRGEQQQHAARAAAEQTDRYRALRPERVGRTARERPRRECREVLHADRRAGQHRAVAEVAVHVAGQHRERNSDREVAKEGEKDDWNDLQGRRKFAAGGRGVGGHRENET